MSLDVRIGINPISWSNDDLPSLGGETPLETALAEGKRIGYQGFELGNKFPREPAALRAKLGEYGMACVSGWYSGRLARQSAEAEIAAVGPHLELLASCGATVMVYGEVADAIQGQPEALYRRPRFKSDAEWSAYGERLNAFGRHLLTRGVRLAYHHHMGAYVQAPEDVDRLMLLTGPDVGLLFDTGHITFAGGDAVAVLAKHIGPRLPRPLQGRAAVGRRAGVEPPVELPRKRYQRRVHGAGRRRCRFPRRARTARRPRLPRLAGRRGGAGPCGGTELPLR
jgi:inosose dehydratase